MKRIYNSDIKFNITNLNLPDEYDFKFYTVDKNTFIEKDNTDAYEEGGNTYIALDWSLLQLLGQGPLSYKLVKKIPDPEFPDRTYDAAVNRVTNYYIVTAINPIDPSESATTLEIIINIIENYEGVLSEELASEAEMRQLGDKALQESVSGLTERVEALENMDFGVTKEYVDQSIDGLRDEIASKEWTGTQEEYDALPEHSDDITYYILKEE